MNFIHTISVKLNNNNNANPIYNNKYFMYHLKLWLKQVNIFFVYTIPETLVSCSYNLRTKNNNKNDDDGKRNRLFFIDIQY